MHHVLETALSDLRAGLGMRRVWVTLAQEDIGDQHRRTRLGPLWLLINYLAFAGTFIFVFHRGGGGIDNYPVYVATGLLVWFFIMETTTQSVTLFGREENFIKGTTLPLSVYVLRQATQLAIRGFYALVGCIAILAVSGADVTIAWAWSALGILLILLIAPAATIVVAFLGAFVPDSQFFVSNLMRLGMFLTPVFWTYDGQSGVRSFFYNWNPFTYVLEIVRRPIIDGDFPADAFLVSATLGVILWSLAVAVLGLYRKRLVFVL